MMSKFEPAVVHSLQPALTMFSQIVRCILKNIVRNHIFRYRITILENIVH